VTLARLLPIVVLASCSTFESTSSSDAGTTAPTTAKSCQELLANDASLRSKNGVYEITPAAGKPSIKVYCNMSLADGGWTMVGRSGQFAPGGAQSFGWTHATGDVADEQYPYSLDVVANAISFKLVLVSDREGAHAYEFPVPPDFLSHTKDVISTGTVKSVGEIPCVGKDGPPDMVKFVGAVALDDIFWLRDVQDLGQERGLTPKGFDMSYDDCPRGGLLNGLQGAIFVK